MVFALLIGSCLIRGASCPSSIERPLLKVPTRISKPGRTEPPIFPRNSRIINGSQKLKLIQHASIHPVHFGEFSFSPTHGQISRNHAFCRCGCLPRRSMCAKPWNVGGGQPVVFGLSGTPKPPKVINLRSSSKLASVPWWQMEARGESCTQGLQHNSIL